MAPTRGLIRVIPGAILEDRNGWEDVDRKLRERMDRLTALGLTVLVIALAVGYQLLPRMDAFLSFFRRRRGVTS
jgi:hypothetical protein